MHRKDLPSYVLIAIVLSITSSYTYAQTSKASTSLSGLDYPSFAVVGSAVKVDFVVKYSVGSYNELLLFTAIGCLQTVCSSIVPLGVSSNPIGCNSTYPFSNYASVASITAESCYSNVTSDGSESFSYSLLFSKDGIYDLTAIAQLNQPGHNLDESGSYSYSQTMYITVVSNQSSAQETTYTSSTYYSTSSAPTSTPSLQMPQPPQSTGSQSTSNTLQLLVIVILAAAVLVALLIYSKRGKKPNTTSPKKADSQKLNSGKSFCIESK